MTSPNRNLSTERKAMYYVGMGLMVLGFLLFISTFISAALSFGDFNDFGTRTRSMMVRAVGGMVLLVVGAGLRNVGARGAAGSGVVLDPERFRSDLEPWSRAAGGMAKDALDEAQIDLAGNPRPEAALPFDEKLRRLERLRQEGLVDEAEYQAKRREILSEDW